MIVPRSRAAGVFAGLIAVGAKASGCSILSEIVSALRAEDVRDLDPAMATAAHRGQLELTLRAEVVAGRERGGAVGAAREDGLAQHEVDHGADAARKHNAHQH